MSKPAIRKNQVWKQKGHDYQVLIVGEHAGRWKTKVLTARPGVFNGTHTMTRYTIQAKYELIK